MKEYRKKLNAIKSAFTRHEELKSEAYALPSTRENSPIIYEKLEESRKLCRKAYKDLEKVAESLGFYINFKIDTDSKFLRAYNALSERVDASINALYDFHERFSCLTII